MVVKTTGDGGRGRYSEATRQLGVAHPGGAAPATPGVAARVGDDPVTHLLVEVARDGGGEKRARASPSGSPRTVIVGSPGNVRSSPAFPDRDQQEDGLHRQPPTDESQDLAGGLIKPLRIVHNADQRPRGGRLGQQAKHRQTTNGSEECPR